MGRVYHPQKTCSIGFCFLNFILVSQRSSIKFSFFPYKGTRIGTCHFGITYESIRDNRGYTLPLNFHVSVVPLKLGLKLYRAFWSLIIDLDSTLPFCYIKTACAKFHQTMLIPHLHFTQEAHTNGGTEGVRRRKLIASYGIYTKQILRQISTNWTIWTWVNFAVVAGKGMPPRLS